MTTKQKLGTIEEVEDLRTVWPNEASDFTPWVAGNEGSSLLGDAIGMELSVDETEHPVGDFSADVLATEEGTGRRVVIENQLEETNHDHLGKIVTYAAGADASYVVWVVKRARDEHRAAVEWLNSHTDDEVGFFLCEVHLYRIGDSAPAPMFTVVEAPNDWTRHQKRIADGSMSQVEQTRLEYWTAFNERAEGSAEFSRTFHLRKPSTDHWHDLSIGVSGVHISLTRIQKRQELGVELYIADDKKLFDALFSKRQDIEESAGYKLEWMRLDGKKASRAIVRRTFDIDDRDDWPEEFDWFMGTALAMKRAFEPYL